MKKTCIVIPVFNEDKHIRGVVSDVLKTGMAVVVVDDGSSDDTGSIISKLEARNPKLETLTHEVNLGKGAAMKTGAEYAFKKGFESVIFMDSDGQHSVADLSNFLIAIKDGADVVYGTRNMSIGMPLIRFIGNKLASVLVNLLFGVYVSDLLCGYRAITKKAYRKIKWESAGYAVETEMTIRIAKAGITPVEVSVATIYHDKFKGVTILDALGILFDVIYWRIKI